MPSSTTGDKWFDCGKQWYIILSKWEEVGNLVCVTKLGCSLKEENIFMFEPGVWD